MGKKLFRKLHLWLSVPFGILIALICFSGAMLVFEDEVTQWAKPASLPCVGAIRHTDFHRRGRSLGGRHLARGGSGYGGVKAFPAADRTYQVSLTKPKRAAVFVNPYTGGDCRPVRASAFLPDHVQAAPLVAGQPSGGRGYLLGQAAGGGQYAALCVRVAVGGGHLVASHVAGTSQQPEDSHRRGWPRFWYGLHVAGGMYVLLLLLLMALTGLSWSFGWYREWVYGLLGADARPLVRALHVGTWGGMATRILYFLAAMVGATLPLTGYYLWIRRLRRK